MDGLIESAALEQLVRFLGRLDEAEDDQKQGVYNIMSIIENLSELQPLSLETVCEKTELIDWLLKRLKVKAFDANKLYASEVLSIICQVMALPCRVWGVGSWVVPVGRCLFRWKSARFCRSAPHVGPRDSLQSFGALHPAPLRRVAS